MNFMPRKYDIIKREYHYFQLDAPALRQLHPDSNRCHKSGLMTITAVSGVERSPSGEHSSPPEKLQASRHRHSLFRTVSAASTARYSSVSSRAPKPFTRSDVSSSAIRAAHVKSGNNVNIP